MNSYEYSTLQEVVPRGNGGKAFEVARIPWKLFDDIHDLAINEAIKTDLQDVVRTQGGNGKSVRHGQ